jgi:hypothetical protein
VFKRVAYRSSSTSPCFRPYDRERVRRNANNISILLVYIVPVIDVIACAELQVTREEECAAQFGTWKLCQRMEKEIVECTEYGVDKNLQRLSAVFVSLALDLTCSGERREQ